MPHKLIVVDLNGVLVRKFRQSGPEYDAVRVGPNLCLVSPAVDILTQFCADNGYTCVVWSSSMIRTIKAIMSAAVGHPETFVHAFDRTLCETDTENPRIGADGTNVAVIKDLAPVWKSMRAVGWDVGPDTTLILDDDAAKVRRNPECAVIVPSYDPPDVRRSERYDEEYAAAFRRVLLEHAS